MKSKAIGCALLALAALTPVSYAIEPHHEYRRLVESAQRMTALKSDLFGDNHAILVLTQPGHGLHFGYVLRGSVGGQGITIGWLCIRCDH